MFDRLFRVEDAKVEHLGLELTLAEVRDIVDTVCRKDVFRYEQLLQLLASFVLLPGRRSWC